MRSVALKGIDVTFAFNFESETHFQTMADAAPLMIWMSSTDKLCTYFNKGWLDFTGRTMKQELGNGWAKGVHPDDLAGCLATYTSAFDAREDFEMTYRLRRKDGEFRLVLYGGAPMFGVRDLFEGYIGSCIDITEHETSIARLAALERENFELEKMAATGRVAAHIAHEINNPLAGIRNAFELIKDAVTEDHPHYHYKHRIEKEIDRISGIVRQMFELYQPTKEAPRPVRLRKTVDDIVSLLQIGARNHDVSIRAEVQELPDILLVPEGTLRQVLFNVVQNAVEASPKNGVVTVRSSFEAEKLVIRVSDQGPGIADELGSRVFEPFFTTKHAKGEGGLGLGLSLSKGLVDAAGGSLTFEDSRIGEGATIRVVLPIG